MMYKNDIVFIEDANNAISKVLFSDLSIEDQKFVTSKNSWVKNLNTIAPEKKESTQSVLDYKFWLILLSLIAFGYYIFTISDRKKLKFLDPVSYLTDFCFSKQ